MATQHHSDNESFIVETILSKICWEETLKQDRPFTYKTLEDLIAFIRSGRARAHSRSYSDAVTFAMDKLRVCQEERTVLRALLSAYFKQVKHQPGPLEDMHWEVTIELATREIFLYHHSTMTRSESFFDRKGFELGSVVTEGRPCRNKKLVELHRQKCSEVTYRILSGR